MGIPGDSLIRAQAAVRHMLQQISGQGHCAAYQQKLVESTAKMLEVPEPIVATAIEAELAAENLVQETIEGEIALFLTPLYRSEKGVAWHLVRLLKGSPAWGEIDTGKAIPWAEEQTGLQLSRSQRQAVSLSVNGKVTVITGGPGVGKTTVVNSILTIVRAKGANVRLCAPTGRAAKRLSDTTGFEAKTVHRLLEFEPKTMGFKHDQDEPLDADLLVMDEVSMMDIVLMNQLLRAVPDHTAVLLVGDVDQLPSVGAGAVLADIIASEVIPTVCLTEIFRQAASSRIIVNAHRINQGLLPEKPKDNEESDFYFIPGETPQAIHAKLMQVVTQRIPAHFGLHPINDVQVLTPMNRGGLGARSLNIDLQARLNPDGNPRINRFGWIYAPNDKIIQTVNNYDKEVFNGDIGRVVRIDEEVGLISINFDGRVVEYEAGELDEISLAYATSVHKSQGSEYPAVVIPLAMQHYMLLERNLLYTAVTRGKKLVVIIGQIKALAMAVKRVGSMKRLTNLQRRLHTLMEDKLNAI